MIRDQLGRHLETIRFFRCDMDAIRRRHKRTHGLQAASRKKMKARSFRCGMDAIKGTFKRQQKRTVKPIFYT